MWHTTTNQYPFSFITVASMFLKSHFLILQCNSQYRLQAPFPSTDFKSWKRGKKISLPSFLAIHRLLSVDQRCTSLLILKLLLFQC